MDDFKPSSAVLSMMHTCVMCTLGVIQLIIAILCFGGTCMAKMIAALDPAQSEPR